MTEPARFDAIRTDRLVMRRWHESDRTPFAALNADPETMRFFPQTLDRPASDAMVERIEMSFDQRGYGLWALEVARTGQFIGFTGLNPMPDDVPGAGGVEIGWRLARHAWHHGYATEAARAALEVAFDGIGLDEIWSMTAVVNEPSQAVMRRLGLVEVARFNHPRVPAGHLLQPHVTYHRGRRVRKASRIQSNISDLLRAAPGLNRADETSRLQVERPVVAAVFLDDAFRDLMAHSFINADDHDYAPARKD